MKTQWQSTTERKLRCYGSPDAGLYGGPGRDWTADTWIFSPLLLPAELPAHIIWTSSTTPRSYASTVGVSFPISVFISLYFRFFITRHKFVLQNVGLEPTTHCLSDNCSPIWANLATKANCCTCLYLQQTKTKGESLWFLVAWGRTRTDNLRLMRPMSYHFSTPQWVQPEDSNLVSRLWTWCPTFRRPLQYQRGNVFPVGAPTTAHERKWTAKVAGGTKGGTWTHDLRLMRPAL